MVARALQLPIVASLPGNRSLLRDGLSVFTLALGLRLLFGALIADTYDPDEFVHLALAHSLAHGAVPYKDFTYFHPPGLLVVLRILDAPVSAWWPVARLVSILLDAVTVTLIWRIGLELYGRHGAFAAAALYAVSPVTLVTAVRVEQDGFVTALGVAGLALLVVHRSRKAALLAGACLAAACWFKYPALVMLPAYLIAGRRNLVPLAVGLIGGLAILFGPFLPEAHLVYVQTVQWQTAHRVPNNLSWRLEKGMVFWLLINPFTVAALLTFRVRFPAWLLAGFGAGAAFLLAPQVYYHYYVPIVPFAALLGAPVAARLRLSPAAVLAAILAFTVAWAIDINASGPGRQFVSATRLSNDAATVRFIEQHTRPGDRILADRFEYAYLSRRTPLPYFWNMWGVTSSSHLEALVPRASLIILTRYAGGETYPADFLTYVSSHLHADETPATTIWSTDPPARESEPTSVRRKFVGSNPLRVARLRELSALT